MEYKKHPERAFRHFISMPFIYFMIFPMVVLDFCLEIYHQICFRLYGLPLVNRSTYIKIDRHKLKYLNNWEKVHCAYCGYANGLAHYFTIIAGETEKYWCGIKHQKDPNFIPPEQHKDFLEYGDAKAYNKLNK
jgi:hypothetical protein